jgi:anti-anti-sigma factor
MPPAKRDPQPAVELRELSDHTAVLTLVGEHDLLTRPRVDEQFERARTASLVIVDLARCTFLDSTVIAALLGARRARGAGRIEIVMPRPGGVAARALHLTGVPEFFPTHATLEDALSRAEHTANV